jgi:hypothetical protein
MWVMKITICSFPILKDFVADGLASLYPQIVQNRHQCRGSGILASCVLNSPINNHKEKCAYKFDLLLPPLFISQNWCNYR